MGRGGNMMREAGRGVDREGRGRGRGGSVRHEAWREDLKVEWLIEEGLPLMPPSDS